MAEEYCCVCGRLLPNRFAVAGRCKVNGCNAAFCALHWHTSNHLCPNHGGGSVSTPVSATSSQPSTAVPVESPTDITEKTETNDAEAPKEATPSPQPTDSKMPSATKTSFFKTFSSFVGGLGKSATAFIDRIRGVEDPNAAVKVLDEQLSAIRAHRQPLQKRFEELDVEIATKKAEYQDAQSIHKQILEKELEMLQAEYQGLQRQLEVDFENERAAIVLRTRMLELSALELRKFHGRDLDQLSAKLDGAVAEQTGMVAALDDLEKAGPKRDV